jgi:type II secretory pathway component GspD/PulD (secretin)
MAAPLQGRLAVIGALLVLAPPAASFADEPAAERARALPCAEVAPGETVDIDLRDAPLSDFVRFVLCATGTNAIVPSALVAGQTVTLVGPRRVEGRTLLPLLHTVLRSHDLALERSGRFWRVVPLP